jgi:hypothetical protein
MLKLDKTRCFSGFFFYTGLVRIGNADARQDVHAVIARFTALMHHTALNMHIHWLVFADARLMLSFCLSGVSS